MGAVYKFLIGWVIWLSFKLTQVRHRLIQNIGYLPILIRRLHYKGWGDKLLIYPTICRYTCMCLVHACISSGYECDLGIK